MVSKGSCLSNSTFEGEKGSNQFYLNMAHLSFTLEHLSYLLKTPSAANTADKLPTFRGRARECDPIFEERNSFSYHIGLFRSFIAMIPNLSMHDKKQFLLRSADSKVCDFYLTVKLALDGV